MKAEKNVFISWRQGAAVESEESTLMKDTGQESQLPIFSLAPKVLLVEDVSALRLVNSEFLKIIGCRVDVARNGQEALLLAKNNYDLILLDIGLPDMDGMTVAQTIRTDGNKSIIVALTSFGNGICKECLASGCDDFYVKPMSLEVMTLVMKRWLPRYLRAGA